MEETGLVFIHLETIAELPIHASSGLGTGNGHAQNVAPAFELLGLTEVKKTRESALTKSVLHTRYF